MTQIVISDEAASSLAAEASRRGCKPEDLASLLIEEGLRRDEQELELTPEQQSRLVESAAQAARGELIDGDHVMRKLDDFLTGKAAG